MFALPVVTLPRPVWSFLRKRGNKGHMRPLIKSSLCQDLFFLGSIHSFIHFFTH